MSLRSAMHASDVDDAGRALQSTQRSVVSISRLTNEMSEVCDMSEGSFGVVKCYRHDSDKLEYAVKQTKRPICGESNLQQQLQEIYALSSFPHRHIVRYFDGWVEDRAVFVRLEKLDDCVASLPPPVSESVLTAMLHQTSTALYELHSHGVLHMDVKPENILTRQLDADTFIFKLCDFGLARPLNGRDSVTGEHFLGLNDDDGDRRYMSPELLKNLQDVVGPPADMYALGKTCEAMMTATEDPSNTSARHLESYSPAFTALIESMLREDPARRPSAFQVVQATLPERLLGDGRLLELQCRLDAIRCEISELDASDNDVMSSPRS
ncbi:putative serine/threonine protein kinase [Leishmania major strain Friedlin]|uniref:Putative serine/threonine protein kinase n=1 Tax=Leishmania major TaxID=5664 RepID=E9AED4_LEIMA|nr:putative serine/threonine protein kinase [Leishmania major strain Friedlin]CAG9578014.1 serine/threonine_protein_kinase_-_putative [Leishmania major strain Friedlin]CBZ12613.1 putative serine/threonine protein kinase [Leishmania major strain Friedlin]|eukprot:XP_003722355.1 putative serine/threonine protein kinase [Leishmania major strain Friedlin]